MGKCQSCGFDKPLSTYTIKDGPELDHERWTPGEPIELCEGCAIFARSHLARFDGLGVA